MLKELKNKYFNKEYSTVKISQNKKIDMCAANIRFLLKKYGIKMREKKCTNSLYFSTKSKIGTYKLLKLIKSDYMWGHKSIKEISKKYGIDQGTVSNKLKQMKIKQKLNRCKSNERCQWCGNIMEYVNITSGTRKQLYCSSKCKHRAVDYRRHIKGIRVKDVQQKIKDDFLKNVWGNTYYEIREKIINVKPIREDNNTKK